MNAYLAREVMPVDTANAMLEYPEDIQIYGFSSYFNAFGWFISGEYSYGPNMPLQVLISDVLMAGSQPALPANEIALLELSTVDPAALLGMLSNPSSYPRYLELFNTLSEEGLFGPDAANIKIPGSRQVAPDGINHDYRSVTAAAGDYIQDLPGLKEGLYIQGLQNFTHPSAGADGTDAPNGEAGKLRFNPTQQTDGFGDVFSWGIRVLAQLEYPNVWNSGIIIKPNFIGFYDIGGITPFPAQDYVEGNIWLLPYVNIEYGNNFSSLLMYQFFACDNNQYRDRDYLTLSFTYSF